MDAIAGLSYHLWMTLTTTLISRLCTCCVCALFVCVCMCGHVCTDMLFVCTCVCTCAHVHILFYCRLLRLTCEMSHVGCCVWTFYSQTMVIFWKAWSHGGMHRETASSEAGLEIYRLAPLPVQLCTVTTGVTGALSSHAHSFCLAFPLPCPPHLILNGNYIKLYFKL